MSETVRRIEALLFAAAEPLSAADLAGRLPDGADVASALMVLKDDYAGRGVNLVCVADRWRFQTAEDLSFLMTQAREETRRLSKAAQETLAIIAYHQPVSRPEIEQLRGTALSQQTLDALLEANLVEPKGRRESPGRPTLWGTTPQFLAQFGLKDLRDLPRREDLLVEPPQPHLPPPLAGGGQGEGAPQDESPTPPQPAGPAC